MSSPLGSSKMCCVTMSTPTIGPSYHTVTLPDGTIIKYLLRGLHNASSDDEEEDNNNEDINVWTHFCAQAFAHKKPIPPCASYFYRHYSNDPRRGANLVRVMVSLTEKEEEKEMASSVRIFRRTLSSGGGCSSSLTFEAGGIGEVCTSPKHRRRGLSTILLHNALTVMQDDSNDSNDNNNNNSGGMSCSVLHASPDFRPYYTKVGGYQSVRSFWSVVPIEYANLRASITTDNSRKLSNAGRFRVRHAIFPQDAPRLYHLYKLYSEQRFVTIARSIEYWEKYVSVELNNSLWVLTFDKGDDICNIVAWMSIKEMGTGRYQLREFGLDKEQITTILAMSRLLHVTLDQVMGEQEEGVSLVLPSFVLSEIKEESIMNDDVKVYSSFMNIQDATEENDDGWMYVNFDNSSCHTSPMPSILELLGIGEHDRVTHLIWPTDSF